MDKQIQDLRDELSALSDDARALLVATTDVAGQKAEEARQRLTVALAKAKDTCGHFRDQVLDRSKGMDQRLRNSPYQALAIALGIGLLLGLIRGTRRNDPPRSLKA